MSHKDAKIRAFFVPSRGGRSPLSGGGAPPGGAESAAERTQSSTLFVRRARRGLAFTLVVAAAIAAPALPPHRSARADDGNAADVATARDLFIQASAAAQKGSWEEARALYERSLALKRAAITLYSLGVAQKRTGQWVEAIESLRAFLAEPSATATKAYEGPARDAIVELTPKLAHVTVTLAGGALEGARVEIDGRRVPDAALGAARPLNPGAHVLTATAPHRTPVKRDVTVKEGESTAVELVLEIEPPAPSATASAGPAGPVTSGAPAGTSAATAQATGTATAPPSLPGEPSRVLPVTLLVGGGALLAGGIAMGLTGVSDAGSAPTRDGPDARRARTEALIGDILAGAGVAAAAAGVVVLVVRWRSAAPASAPPAAVTLGPAGIAVRGRF